MFIVNKSPQKYASVVVNRKISAVDRIFDYLIPENLWDKALLGSVVEIPFGYQVLEGIIVALKASSDYEKGLKEIKSVISPQPLFSEKMIELSLWMANYYLCPWVSALQAMLPGGLTLSGRIPKGFLLKIYTLSADIEKAKLTAKQKLLQEFLEDKGEATAQELKKAGFSADIIKRMVQKNYLSYREEDLLDEEGLFSPQRVALNDEQKQIFTAVLGEMAAEKRPFLLWGITGSGKTEIYLHLMEKALQEGGQCLFLVPEIALTAQMADNLSRRLSVPIAILHSGLKESEKRNSWQKISQGDYPVVLGARSAVFAPLQNLSLIIMDEEHEYSYKQDITPRFHCREVARQRCLLENAQLVLGSATPSLESFYQSQKGDYALGILENRYFSAPLPQVEVADMRRELREGNRSIFSRILAEELAKTLANGEQSLVLINRRGYYTFFSCRNCGKVILCPHCDIPMAYHEKENKLKCHYCGALAEPPRVCPQCGSSAIRHFGIGTQRVADELTKLFPQAHIGRLDYDSSRQKGNYKKIYQEMLEGKIDILVGTQMIAKGLDFPNVHLAAVIAADISLNIPDFRGGEKTFQLLTQITGRAGRRQKQGLAIIQTYYPQSPIIKSAAQQRFADFYQRELAERESHGYPPFLDLWRLLINGQSFIRVQAESKNLALLIASLLESYGDDQTVILGPSAPPYEKIKDRYRQQIILKSKNRQLLAEILPLAREQWQSRSDFPKDIFLQIDVDPYSMM